MNKLTYRYYTQALYTFILLCGCVASAANAANSINLTSSAMQEVVEIDAKGKETIKLVSAKRVVPGNEVIYVIDFENTGSEAAENIEIRNPVPEYTSFKAGSATGTDTAISYSIDNGDQFNAADKLTIKDSNGSVRTARADEYTTIRWMYTKPLPPGEKSSVQYRVVIQ